jgi:arylsulfatase A-like enzyme
VPFIIRWPGTIPANTLSKEIVHKVDMFNTLASIGGAKLPNDLRS